MQSAIKTLKLIHSFHFKFLVPAVRMPGQFRASVLITMLTVFFHEYLDGRRRKEREVAKTAWEASRLCTLYVITSELGKKEGCDGRGKW